MTRANISRPCSSQERLRCARKSSPSFLRKPPAERQPAFEAFVITRLGFLVIVALGGGEAVFRPEAPRLSRPWRPPSLLRPSRWRAWPGALRSAVYRSRPRSCGRLGLPSLGLLRSGGGERSH